METTDLRTLRAEFIARITAMTPNSARQDNDERLDRPWAVVDKVQDVPSGDLLRRFYVGFDAEGYRAVGDGIFGEGVEIEVPLQVWVNYGGLQDNEDADLLIIEDGLDLYYLLDRIRDPVLQGFVGPMPLDFPAWRYADEGDNPGAIWGAFTFVIRYLARDS